MKYEQLLHEYISKKKDHTGKVMLQLGLMYFLNNVSLNDKRKGLKFINEAAKIYPYANTILGNMYLDGQGVEINLEEGLKLLHKAADESDTLALFKLGNLYLEGNKVPANPKYAIQLFKKSSENGSTDATFALGLLYFNSSFVKTNYKKAYRYFQKAHEKKHIHATALLGFMYEKGYFVKKDINYAIKLYLKATSQNSMFAHYFLGLIYINNSSIKQNIPEGIQHLEIAAQKGYLDAHDYLLNFYLNEDSTYCNYPKAIKHLQVLIEHNDAFAKYVLGKIYYEGKHCPQDIRQAIILLSDSSLGIAYHLLGKIYLSYDVPYNPQLAIAYFQKAIVLGNIDSIYEIAKLVLKGFCDIKIINELTAQANTKEGAYLYSLFLIKGIQIERDLEKGVLFMQKAIKLKHKEAKYTYAKMLISGEYFLQDLPLAINLLTSLIRTSFYEAACDLYKIYNDKNTTFYNRRKARHYLDLAKEHNVGEIFYILSLETDDIFIRYNLLKKSIKLNYEEGKSQFLNIKHSISVK